MCKLLNDQMITAKGKRYKVERWQGMEPYYIFNSLEEDRQEPIEKSLQEVTELIKNGIIKIGI